MEPRDRVQVERQHAANEIVARLKACIAGVLRTYPVDIAYLYGSVAHGRPLPSSDVDIALVLTDGAVPAEPLPLELEIQARLEDASGLSNLDVRVINRAPLIPRGRIVQEGILLYERDKRIRVAFEALTRREYLEYLPVATEMQQAFLDHLRREGLSGGRSKDHRLHPKQSARLPG